MTARRWPLATIAIVCACIACFVAMLASGGDDEKVTDAGTRAAEYWELHSYLVPPPPLDRLVARARIHAPPPSVFDRAPPSEEEVAEEQQYLDSLCDAWRRALDESPQFRFGYVPARGGVTGLVTYQFLHGGVLHLVFNLWFFWLCGCNLEDRWGRLVFVPFYLGGGVVAALAHKVSAPDSMQPIIGASGAIAGAMGAFLVSFAKTRIRFFYWLWFRIRPGTFSAPAYVMLPLWIAQEVLSGLVWSNGDGVAHWAHVGGFVYGVALAIVLRATGWERKLDEAVERKISVTQDERIMRAADLTTAGRAAEAIATLDVVVTQRPDDVDAHLEMLRAAKATRDAAREGQAYARLVRLYLDRGAPETALDLLAEAQASSIDAAVPVDVRMRLADRLVVKGLADRAWAAYASITRAGLGDAAAVRAAIAQAKIARRLGRMQDARALLDAVTQSPFATPETGEMARAEIARLEA